MCSNICCVPYLFHKLIFCNMYSMLILILYSLCNLYNNLMTTTGFKHGVNVYGVFSEKCELRTLKSKRMLALFRLLLM